MGVITKTSEQELIFSCSVRKLMELFSISEQYSKNIKDCKIPVWCLNRKIEKRKRQPESSYRVIGYDSESVTKGNDVGPFLSGFWGEFQSLDYFHSGRVNPQAHFQYFLAMLDEFSKHDFPTVVYAHNLEWDMTQIMIKMFGHMQGDRLQLPFGSGYFEINLTQPCFGVLRQKHRRTVFVRDTFAFFKNSLRETAKALGLHQKEAPFKDIGLRVFSWDEMKTYFEGDLKSVCSIGRYITDLHSQFGVPECTLSIPHFASSIFRQSIKKPLTRFPHPKFGLQTYYGGKTRSNPGIYHNIKCYDVNSEYPFSMTKLPKLCCGSYLPTLEYKGPWGIYILKNYDFKKCDYGTFYHNKIKIKGENLRFIDTGFTDPFFATGWDIEAALYCKSVKIRDISGYYWKEKPCKHPNIFEDFVRRCYLMRMQCKREGNDILGLTYKLILNSLYGKFSQFRYESESGTWKPGALFDPAIAGMITGYGRYLIHTLEHAGKSVYTSTDSVMTTEELTTGEGLGDLKHEFTASTLVIIRNKVYFAFDKNFKLIKWAGHGLQCDSVGDLIKALANSESFIKKGRLIKRREGIRRKKVPGSYDERVQNIEDLNITPEMRVIFKKALSTLNGCYHLPQTL